MTETSDRIIANLSDKLGGLQRENTRLQEELKASEEAMALWAGHADRRAARISTLEAANTPLHTTAAHAGCPEGKCQIKRTIEQLGGQLLRINAVLRHHAGYRLPVGASRQIQAILDEPAVTGTTSALEGK